MVAVIFDGLLNVAPFHCLFKVALVIPSRPAQNVVSIELPFLEGWLVGVEDAWARVVVPLAIRLAGDPHVVVFPVCLLFGREECTDSVVCLLGRESGIEKGTQDRVLGVGVEDAVIHWLSSQKKETNKVTSAVPRNRTRATLKLSRFGVCEQTEPYASFIGSPTTRDGIWISEGILVCTGQIRS